MLPSKVLNWILVTLRAAIVLIVAAWILDIPSRFQIALFTEQVLVAVLGVSLALTFLTFPLFGDTGEEAVAAKVLHKKVAVAGPFDIALALVALLSCLYIAVRYQDLIVELVARPWWGVALSTIVVLLVFEASRRVTGWALIIIVLVLCAHALWGYLLPEA